MAGHQMKVVSADDFDLEVLRIDRPVVVDFSAAWCGPCRALAPTMEELAREFDGQAGVVQVDVDEHPELAERFRVASIPCLIVFRGGQEVRRIVGAVPKARIAEALEDAIRA